MAQLSRLSASMTRLDVQKGQLPASLSLLTGLQRSHMLSAPGSRDGEAINVALQQLQQLSYLVSGAALMPCDAAAKARGISGL